ncbi:non-ribosomal peptide synthetase [Micromonospora antibiotica]|uniref:Amino acid adenylation domain-containing protein n=1 Tax=Micromonospora antibiotica TaxID=2807623 RepID=A0ABS3V790_9ACTN|nr:non-ribosomal peptide synthetase [Micromonospora antibiotica]MBO4161485.1 amino acid adenylation domain-containing protein [Micromonospora antibiotica]
MDWPNKDGPALDDRHRVLAWGRGPVTDIPPITLPGVVARTAARWPDATALVGGACRLTYQQLDRAADRLAHRLRAHGVGPETAVGVCVRRTPFMVVALLGVLRAGGYYVPLDTGLPAERMELMLADASVGVCVVDDDTRDLLPPGPWELMTDEPDDAGTPPPQRLPDGDPGDLAYVLYTSGSTGRPKGVCVEHRSVVDFVLANAECWGVGPTDRMLALASLGFDVSVAEIFTALAVGATLVIAADDDRLSVDRLRRLLRRERVTVAEVPQSVLGLLDPAELPDIRLVPLGGEAPNPLVTAHWVRAGKRVINNYGPTETTVTATMMDCPAQDLPSVPIGRPMPNHRVYVLDDDGLPVPPGMPGELWVAGPGVARGYLGQPALTAERFRPDHLGDAPGGRRYRTGDRARWNQDGTLEFLGRVDVQLNLRGFRIEPGDVETRLRAHTAVTDAVVSVVAGQLVGYVVPVDASPGGDELDAWCATHLPRYMVPSVFVTVDSLPLTMSGKVDRAALPPPGPAAGERAAPRTTTEKQLLAIWQEVLPPGPIGVDDPFTDAGGNSLLAMQVLARVRRVFGVELPPAALLRGDTVAGQARDIDAATPADPDRPLLRRLDPDEPAPLSHAQRQLWFVDQLGAARGAFNLPVALRLRGTVDPAALAQALGDVVATHDALRMSFPAADGEPRVRVDQPAPILLTHTDLRHVPADRRDAALGELARTEAELPFVLASGPLWRARLVHCGDSDWALLFVVHHAVADGWSLSLLLDELGRRYHGRTTGTPTDLVAPQVGYGDYAAWQRATLSGARHQRQLDFWTRTLAGVDPVLELPADRPRPPVQSYRAGRLAVRVGREVTDPLRAVAAQHRVTPYVGLLAVFTALLGRLTGVDDLVVAAPMAGRPEPELERVVGLFVNTVPVRADLSATPNLDQLVTRVGEQLLAAMAHASVPFDLVVEAVRPPRTASRHPLVQVGINLLNQPPERLSMDGVEVTPIPLDPPGSLLDLTLYAREDGDELAFELVYNLDLFDHQRMRVLLGQYVQLLTQAVTEPGRRLVELSLRAAGHDAGALPDPGRSLSGAGGPTVVTRVRAAARRTPDAIAVTGPDATMTYGQLERDSDRLADALSAAGVGHGDIVAVPAVRAARMAAALLGVLKSRAVVALLDAAHPPARLTAMLHAVTPAAWLTVDGATPPAALAGYLDSTGVRRVDVAATLQQASSRPRQDEPADDVRADNDTPSRPDPQPDDPAHILFTSGSTGTPRAVLAAHRSLAHFVDWYAGQFGLGPDDRFAVTSGVAHDPVLRDLLVPLCLGATVHVPPPQVHRAPDQLARWLGERKVTVLHSTPQLGRLLASSATGPPGGEPIRLPALRLVATGGDVLLATDVTALATLAPQARVVALYGATETPQAMAWQAAAEAGGRPRVPVGHGIDDVQLLIENAAGALAGVGELGEIVVRSPHVALGYVGDPALTADRFVEPTPGDRRYRTGDLGRYLPDGRVEFAGRRDGQVKIRGYRVELAEVTAMLEAHPDVARAVATVTVGPGGEPELVGYAVAEQGHDVRVEELDGYVRAFLPPYAVPTAIQMIDGLPIGVNGKIDLTALPSPPRRRLRVPAYRPPRSPVEQLIAAAWRDVLALPTVGLDDNFFDLGGSSLSLVTVQTRLQAGLQRALSVVDLYQYPTIRLFAAHLSGDAPTGATRERTTRRIADRLAGRARRYRPIPSSIGREDLV